MKTRNTLQLLFACSALILAACDVKDPIFNTSHPGHGMVTLTTQWSAIGEGLTAPESYTVTAGTSGTTGATAYTATLTGVTNKLDHLFDPGTYRFLVYNTPEHITVSGTTATVAQAAVTPTDASPADNPERLVHNTPGWLFTNAQDATLAADTEHTLTAPMQQQVRQLTLVIEPTGGTTDRIESITGILSGVAGTLNIADGTHGAPSLTALTFTKITSGADAGKWSATVRLLGIAGEQQWLTGSIAFAGGNPMPVFFDSDLTQALASFNTDKRLPKTLGSSIKVETPTEGEFSATITDWETVTGGPVVAD